MSTVCLCAWSIRPVEGLDDSCEQPSYLLKRKYVSVSQCIYAAAKWIARRGREGKTERLNLIVPTQINIRDNAPTKPWQWRHSATRYIKQLTWRLLSLGIALAKLNDTYTSWSVSDMLKNFNTRTTSIWKIRLASSGPNGSSPRLSGLASSLIIWGPTTYRVYCIPQRVLRRGKRDS